jgi:hypothetical protein
MTKISPLCGVSINISRNEYILQRRKVTEEKYVNYCIAAFTSLWLPYIIMYETCFRTLITIFLLQNTEYCATGSTVCSEWRLSDFCLHIPQQMRCDTHWDQLVSLRLLDYSFLQSHQSPCNNDEESQRCRVLGSITKNVVSSKGL